MGIKDSTKGADLYCLAHLWMQSIELIGKEYTKMHWVLHKNV